MPSIFLPGQNQQPMFSEAGRRAITFGLGSIPIAGPFLAGGYLAARGVNALAQYLKSRNDPDYGNPNYIGLGDPVPTPGAENVGPPQATTQPPPSNPGLQNYQQVTGQTDPLAPLLSYGQGTTAGGGGGSPLQAAQAFRNSNITLPAPQNYQNPQANDPNYFTNHFGGFITPSAFIGGGRAGGGSGSFGRSAGFLVQ
jgi:hypothetical protein